MKGVTDALIRAANNQYCDDDYVADLCKFLTDLRQKSLKNFARFIFNGKDKTCRDLADWWEEHEKADRAREIKEQCYKMGMKEFKNEIS